MRDHGLSAALSEAQRAESEALTQRMARAAGSVQPAVMLHACYVLMQTAFMAANPDGYIDWRLATQWEGVRHA